MVLVRVDEGWLKGEIVQNEYGGRFYSFKGIPYAQPPVGDLRFKPPQPSQPWTGVRDAKQFGPICFQVNIMNPNLGNMSEDCLYLNVYTPNTTENNLPVMVWIHGGGYLWGSGDDDVYGPQFLLRQGVILVTFNYRLEALGFLCLDTPDVPGNAGMKDQVAALRWVKKNIQNFGGDPDNITIFGESAGGSSVSFHLVSPMSKGLFRRAIAQSGAANCRWAQDLDPRSKVFILAKLLGCNSEDTKELFEFFKQQPVESLINLNVLTSKSFDDFHFAITSEKDFGQERFFYGDVMETLRNGVHEGVEIMTGYTEDEGLMALVVSSSLEDMINKAKHCDELFIPHSIKRNCSSRDQLEVGRRIRHFYMKNGDLSRESFLKFLGTNMFVYDVMLAAKIYSKTNKVYLYKFTCKSERNFLGHCFGLSDVIQDKLVVCHADDLAYLFPIKVVAGKVEEKSESFTLIDRVTKLWTNFAKYGHPTADNNFEVDWKAYSIENEDYLDIGNELKSSTAPDKEELEFWDNIVKQFVPNYRN